jgi:hypothetical protein
MAQWLIIIITGCGLDDCIYWQLLLQSLVITINYQELTINLQPNPSSLTAEDSHHSRSRSTTPSNWTTLTLISSRHGPLVEITALPQLRAHLLGFPRDHYPASPLARCLLLSNGLGVNYIEVTASVFMPACLFDSVYIATGFSRSVASCFEQIRHSIYVHT